MQNILVIRFGSLGDLCLLGWSLARLADAPGGENRTVTLVTKQGFAPLMARVRGVDQVVSLDDSGLGGLLNLTGRLRASKWDTILDAHNILRSHGLQALLGRRPDRRLKKDTSKRLALLRGAESSVLLERTMRQRFDELLEDMVPDLLTTISPPLVHLASKKQSDPILGLAPGAQWDTKRWPEKSFQNLLTEFRKQSNYPVRIFLGPREESWFPESSLAKVAQDLENVTVIRDQSLTQVASQLAQCTALITNDSGLLHVAEAVGTPVLAFFGPTVRQFGYFPSLPESAVLEIPLDCRPCSRNGKRSCHRQDLACLEQIPPEQALPFINRMFP